MNERGKRQLPSWMMRSSGEASIPEKKNESKEIDSEEPNNKAYEPQKKLKGEKDDIGVRQLDKKIPSLKKCEARTRKRKDKSITEDEDHKCGRELQVLKPCRISRNRVELNKQEDQGVDLMNSDNLVRSRFQGCAQGMKKKAKMYVEDSHDGEAPSEDELTVEDLVRIAEEFISADAEKELKKLKNLELESEARNSVAATIKVGSGKYPTVLYDKTHPSTSSLSSPLPCEESTWKDSAACNDKSLPSSSSLCDPLPGERSITHPSNTCDSGQDILSLFFGPLLKNLR